MNERIGPVVAIDGPAGAGKSTVARAVAERLGVPHLDTGAMYRSITWAVLHAGADPDDPDAATAAAASASVDVSSEAVRVDGIDVTAAIRGPDVTAAVSAVSSHPGVRTELVRHQRAWVEAHGSGVLEGRDIGTVVLPDADLKIYLTATARTRAERRMGETAGEEDLERVVADIERRDELDSNREHSPLRPADDAVTVWTDDLDVDGVVDSILALVPDGGYGPRP